MSSINVQKANVPSYLQESEFYKALNLEGDEEITVPSNCFKCDDIVNSLDDLGCLLSSLQFWGVQECPSSVVHFLLLDDEQACKWDVALEFHDELLYVDLLHELYNKPSAERLQLAIEQGNLVAVRYLLSLGKEPDAACFVAACEHNRLECLKCICSQCNRSWLDEPTMDLLVFREYLAILEYLHSEGFNVARHSAAYNSALQGNVAMLKFFLDLNNPDVGTGNVCFNAAYKNHLDCLKLAYERSLFKPALRRTIMTLICEQGYLDIIKYLHAQGEPFEEAALAGAASRGRLEVIQFLHEQGCPWSVSACSCAADQGHMECLIYLHQHGCPWNEGTAAVTAVYGRLDCLKYLLDHGCPLDASKAINGAASSDNVKVVQFLHEYGHPLPHTLYVTALRYGALRCLAYLHEQGVAWGNTTTDEAATGGHLQCLQYAHENGCPWGPNTCDNAATNHHPECLIYAHQNGCPWDVSIYKSKEVYRSFSCNAYIQEQLAKLELSEA